MQTTKEDILAEDTQDIHENVPHEKQKHEKQDDFALSPVYENMKIYEEVDSKIPPNYEDVVNKYSTMHNLK